ncbi:hypothetical protein [Ruminococcus sp.]|uniref:hypothetical protein n=1 Tax=Ruminococcus sp. TaxID=41978 RepID=UPI0025F53D32|nr:hypothetical protein [Ruminococcus sp.]
MKKNMSDPTKSPSHLHDLDHFVVFSLSELLRKAVSLRRAMLYHDKRITRIFLQFLFLCGTKRENGKIMFLYKVFAVIPFVR